MSFLDFKLAWGQSTKGDIMSHSSACPKESLGFYCENRLDWNAVEKSLSE